MRTQQVQEVQMTRASKIEVQAGRTCRVIRPPSADACGKRATTKLVWTDDTTSDACADCAMYLKQVAESHHTVVRVEPLR